MIMSDKLSKKMNPVGAVTGRVPAANPKISQGPKSGTAGIKLAKVKKGDILHADNSITNVTFVKVERANCPHNERIHAYVQKPAGNGGPFDAAKAKRGLIYDYDVMVNGEKRGTFMRDFTGREYHLMNLAGEPWRYLNTDKEKPKQKWSYTKRTTYPQFAFTSDTMEALEQGHLITPAQAVIVARNNAVMQQRENMRKYKEACLNVISDHATQMYHLLTRISSGDVPAGKCRAEATTMMDKIKMPPMSEYVK